MVDDKRAKKQQKKILADKKEMYKTIEDQFKESRNELSKNMKDTNEREHKVWNGFIGLVENEFNSTAKDSGFRGTGNDSGRAVHNTGTRFFLFDEQTIKKNNEKKANTFAKRSESHARNIVDTLTPNSTRSKSNLTVTFRTPKNVTTPVNMSKTQYSPSK
jgi:hypothetical protein